MYLFFALLFISWGIQAQKAVVTGRVLDASNGEVLEFATVFVKGEKNSVSSDEKGRFTLQVPARQRLTLTIRRVGFSDSSLDILPLAPEARFKVEINLP